MYQVSCKGRSRSIHGTQRQSDNGTQQKNSASTRAEGVKKFCKLSGVFSPIKKLCESRARKQLLPGERLMQLMCCYNANLLQDLVMH